MLMPKMRHFGFKTRLCLLGRTQRTGSDLSKNVLLVTVLESMKILKCCFSQLGQGPPLNPWEMLSSHFQLDPLRSKGGTGILYFSGSKMEWRQGPSAALWRLHLKGKLVFRGAHKSPLGSMQEVRESACESCRMS